MFALIERFIYSNTYRIGVVDRVRRETKFNFSVQLLEKSAKKIDRIKTYDIYRN